jgi:hypothetical protein
MNRILIRSLQCAAAFSLVSLTHGALPTGYEFDITTSYSFSAPADLAAGMPVGSPDTGYLQVLNAGLTTFSGSLSLSGVTPSLASFVENIPSITLAPGQHISLSLNAESSNQGGYIPNGPGNPQSGAQFSMVGNVTDGTDTESVFLQVFDGDIHSGVPRDVHASPSAEGGAPLFSDSYVIQGGDPFGGDTGDAFETTQAPGHFVFLEGNPNTGVPDTGSTMALLGLAFASMATLKKRA